MSAEIIESFIRFLSGHPYLYTFIALLFVGESVLLPVIFLSITGDTIDIRYIFLIAVIATVISDSLWYYLGRMFPPTVHQRFTGKRARRVMEKLDSVFAAKGPQILFLSKFVYGTRIAAQVLSGVHRMPFGTYTVVNTLGVVALMAVLVAIGYSVEGTIQSFGAAVHAVETAFLGFVIVAVLIHLIIGKLAKKTWFR